MYCIYLIKRPGVYLLATSVEGDVTEGAFKRDGRLFKQAFIVILLQTLAQ